MNSPEELDNGNWHFFFVVSRAFLSVEDAIFEEIGDEEEAKYQAKWKAEGE